jgi:NADH-quinone oxidoreductase subunit N
MTELNGLLPVATIALGALAAIGAEPFLKGVAKHRVLPWINAVFLCASASILLCCSSDPSDSAAPFSTAAIFQLAVLGCALLGTAGLQNTLRQAAFPGGEPYGLLLLSSAGAMLMVQATDLLFLYLALELTAFPVYALVGLRRKALESNEALFKYFVSGAVFSAVFLYGVALTYGATGSTAFSGTVLAGREPLLLAGQVLVAVGLLFKVGAAPFHFWVADAYSGAPAAVTGYMAAVVKMGAFVALGGLWTHWVGSPFASRLFVLLLACALLSVFVGSFTGLAQRGARRILAMSAVTNAGFILLGFMLPLQTAWYFLLSYALASCGALVALSALASSADTADGDSLAALQGAGYAHPFVGSAATLALASLAGIPLLVGFLAKFNLFAGLVSLALAKPAYWAIAVPAFVLAVMTAVYYLRLAFAIWAYPQGAHRREHRPPPVRPLLGIALAGLVLALFALAVKNPF